MPTAAIYIRKSREEAGKPSHRLTVQRDQLPQHAEAQGWSVSIYDDDHASAARGKVEDLRERTRLEQDIRAGKINIVLCIELSRLSRDDSLQDYVAWLHLCSEHRVKLATPSRILDPAQHSDWMLLLMEGGFSSVEMKVLQARMKEGRAQAFRAGKYLSGNPPIPYLYDKGIGGLVVDKKQLPTFRRMMDLLEKLPARHVAEKVGVTHITVRRAISDERLLFYQGLRIDPDTGETIQGQWPAVIDADQADRIKAARIPKASGYHRRHHAGLLSNLGVVYCGYCQRPIRAWQGGRKRKDGSTPRHYGCPGKENSTCPPGRMFMQKVLDEKIIGNLLGVLGRTADLERYWLDQQRQPDPQTTLADLEREQAANRQKKQRLVAAIAEGIIDWSDARTKSQQIDQTLADIDARKKALQQTGQSAPDWAILETLAAHWDLLTEAEQRETIALAIEHIQLYANYLVITYHFPKSPDGSKTSRVHLPPPLSPGRSQKNTKTPGS